MKKMFIVIALLLIGLSCSEAPFDPFYSSRNKPTPVLLYASGDYTTNGWPTDTLDLDSRVVISLSESSRVNRYGYDNGADPYIVLLQKTEREYPLSSMEIRQEIHLSPGVLQFTHQYILKPSLHSDTTRHAYHRSYLDMPNGEYDLYFYYNDMTDHYLIDLDDSLITLIPIDTNYTRPAYTKYRREKP